jgi:uncharacterized membrane protein YfcA
VTLFLFLAAFFGGALNAVAGGGSFIALPALIFAGVPPVSANATTTLALWPGSLSSAWAYRREVAATRRWIVALGGVSLAGGLIGGLLLLRTTDASFLRLLPWLLLIAAITFTFAGRVQDFLRRRHPGGSAQHLGGSAQHLGDSAQHPGGSAQHLAGSAQHPGGSPQHLGGSGQPLGGSAQHLWPLLFQLLIAIYGGYFGGGMGIMMLAALSVAGMSDIHEMNGVKSVLAVVINGVALAEFIALGAIAWAPGLVMVAGGIAGGYAGAATARRIDQQYVRGLVTVVAWAMTAYFFIR